MMSSDSIRPAPEHALSPAPSPGEQARRDAWVQKLLGEPGVWYMRQGTISGDGDAAAPATVIRPIYLRRLDPAAPLPDDVDPAATRYEACFELAHWAPWQPAAKWLGLLSLLTGVTALLAGMVWSFAALLVGVVAMAYGSDRKDELRFEPCQDGRWVEAPGEPGAAEPTRPVPTWAVHLSRVICVLCAAALIFDWGSLTWSEGLSMLLGVMIFGQVGFPRLFPFRREDPAERLRAKVRFYELADPARPLAPDAAPPPLNDGVAGRALPNAAPAARAEATRVDAS